VFGLCVDDGADRDVEAAAGRRERLAIDGVEEDAAVVQRMCGVAAALDHVRQDGREDAEARAAASPRRRHTNREREVSQDGLRRGSGLSPGGGRVHEADDAEALRVALALAGLEHPPAVAPPIVCGGVRVVCVLCACCVRVRRPTSCFVLMRTSPLREKCINVAGRRPVFKKT
jgi:hypothetical protein